MFGKREWHRPTGRKLTLLTGCSRAVPVVSCPAWAMAIATFRSVDACVSHRRLRKDSNGPRWKLYTLYGATCRCVYDKGHSGGIFPEAFNSY